MSAWKFRILVLALALIVPKPPMVAKERHLLYVATPGIRNYVEYGGNGCLGFDMDNGYKFIKRIPTWSTPAGKQPENVKAIAASAETARLYVSTITRVPAIDLKTAKI